MQDEFDALIKTGTWDLVPMPTGVNIVKCMWLFKHKYRSNGDLERHKARLVRDDMSQEVSIDCDETFSPVVKPATTIRTVLSLALATKWLTHQLDVKNVFLYGDLQETVIIDGPEDQLHAISELKSQPPADAVARRYLSDSEAGEQESLRILNVIRNSTSVRNLSGFIVHLDKKNPRSSPPSPRSPLPASAAVSPQGNTSSVDKQKRESDCPGDASTARKMYIFNSPTMVEEKPVVLKSKRDIVLDALETLEFRKTFLLFNYIGWDKLKDVSADVILSYQRLGMRQFEIEIWNHNGIDPEKERVNKMNWDTGERYNYHCHIDSEGNSHFKGPYLDNAATLLQKNGDEKCNDN